MTFGWIKRICLIKDEEPQRQERQEAIVINYDESMPSGLRLEGDTTSPQSYYARMERSTLLWYIRSELVGYRAESLCKDIQSASSLRNQEKFQRHASSILHGRRKHWVPVAMTVRATSLTIEYENTKTENKGEIVLDFASTEFTVTFCVSFDFGNNFQYEIEYEPAPENRGCCHVFGKNKLTGEVREYDFARDSDEVHVCYTRPQGCADR